MTRLWVWLGRRNDKPPVPDGHDADVSISRVRNSRKSTVRRVSGIRGGLRSAIHVIAATAVAA